MPTIKALVAWTPILLVFPAVGLLSGWLAGASASPVATVLLPLVFGLLGGISYSLLESHWITAKLENQLAIIEDDNIKQSIHKFLDKAQLNRPILLPALWAAGVVLFCVFCYEGVLFGYATRSPDYPPLAKLAGNTSSLHPIEIAKLHQIRWQMQTHNFPLPEAQAFFIDCIEPLVKKDISEQDRQKALDQLIYIVKGRNKDVQEDSEDSQVATGPVKKTHPDNGDLQHAPLKP